VYATVQVENLDTACAKEMSEMPLRQDGRDLGPRARRRRRRRTLKYSDCGHLGHLDRLPEDARRRVLEEAERRQTKAA
jgi:hypothetical protein